MTSPDTLAQIREAQAVAATVRDVTNQAVGRWTGRDFARLLDSLLALVAERERERDEARQQAALIAAGGSEAVAILTDEIRAERDATVREAAALREALERIAPHDAYARAALAAAAPAETAR